MKHALLITSLATIAKVMAVSLWVVLVGLPVVPVAIDQTGIFGEPHLPGNRLIPGDFGELPTDRTPAYRIRSGLLAGGILLLIVIAVCPHRFIARHRFLLWPAVVFSTLPALDMAYIVGSDILTTQPPDWWSLEDSLIATAALVLIAIALLSLPASLMLHRLLLSQDRTENPAS